MNKVKYNFLSLLLMVSVVFSVLLSGTSPALAVATEPSLGTAANFAVMGGSGVTNTGSTVLIGDVGSWPTPAVGGFPPGTFTGTLHAADAVAAQAQVDITTAYNVLAGQPFDVDKSGQDLGGQTLTPGVYSFSTSAQLTGDLTLNALGDPNAVWVFQIGSTLTTASNSRVLVINGGSNCKVYWQVGSSATLGTASAIAGNILALHSITMTTGATLAGRALARNGAVTLDTNNVAICPACPVITLTPATLPNGTIGVAYNQPITAAGGTAPYTYTIIAGAQPTGLTLNAGTGVLSGVPTATGSFTFTVQAIDSLGCFGSKIYNIIINGGACPIITLAPPILPAAITGTPYSQTITATGGTAPYTFAIIAGSPPTGLALNVTTGVLSGVPTASGSFTFTVQATDSLGCFGSRIYDLLVNCPLITVLPPTLPNGTLGKAYSQTITASGGTAPYTFAIIAGSPPTGLTLNVTTGVLSGVPTAVGNFTFTVRATDFYGCSGGRVYTFVMATPAPAARNQLHEDDNSSVSPQIVTGNWGWCTRPDRLCVKYLSVQPQEAQVNQPVTLFANVVNRCDLPDTYKVTLKVNGIEEETRTVSVGALKAVPVEFTITGNEPGLYNLDLNGEKAFFVVSGEQNKAADSSNTPSLVGFILLFSGVILLSAVVLIRHFRVLNN